MNALRGDYDIGMSRLFWIAFIETLIDQSDEANMFSHHGRLMRKMVFIHWDGVNKTNQEEVHVKDHFMGGKAYCPFPNS